jgi:hypothetical protein
LQSQPKSFFNTDAHGLRPIKTDYFYNLSSSIRLLSVGIGVKKYLSTFYDLAIALEAMARPRCR